MSVAAVLRPADYESRLQRYLFERAEESRAVRVGEKEVSERAEIVARYAELFTRDQLEALREAESETEADVSGIDDPVARTEEEKGISVRELERALAAASDAATEVYTRLKERWL